MNTSSSFPRSNMVFEPSWREWALPAATDALRDNTYTVIVPDRQDRLMNTLQKQLGPRRVRRLGLIASAPPEGHIVFCSQSRLSDGPDEAAYTAFLRLLKAMQGRSGGRLDVVGLRSVAGPETVPVRHALDAVYLGLARTAAQEMPHLTIRTFSSYAIERVVLDCIVGASFENPSNQVVLIEPDRYLVETLGASDAASRSNTLEEATAPSVGFREGGRYLVLGGSGGLGRVFTAYLTRVYGAEVISLSRKAMSDADVASLSYGTGQVRSVACDLCDAAAVEHILEEHRPFHGVIHSALTLKDQTIASLEPQDYIAALRAKVHSTVNLIRALDHRPLDFVLFFSSIQSWLANPGQGAYTAACLAKDALAALMRQILLIETRTVNWGYWGSIGVVASDFYRDRMRRIGVDSIEPEDALPIVESLLAGPRNRIAVIKAAPEALKTMNIDRQDTTAAEELGRPLLPDFDPTDPTVRDNVAGSIALEAYSRHRLEEVGLPRVVADRHCALARSLQTVPSAPAEAPDRQTLLQRFPHMVAHVNLLENCLADFHEILAGRIDPLSVLFPNGSFERVERIYRGNPVADYYNGIVADGALSHKSKLNRPVRVLEIGAGTGSATHQVIPRLEPGIAEYCFTDLSHAFLKKAREDFAGRDYLKTSIYNVEKQAPPDADYDIVVATNVIHATGSIRASLRNIRAALRDGGVLLLNEVTSNQTYATLTFGLTEGWWLNTGQERIAGSPLLSEGAWRDLLAECGFGHVEYHGNDEQGVFAAHAGTAIVSPSVRVAQAEDRPTPSAPSEIADDVAIRDFVKVAIAGVMGMDTAEIEDAVPFAEYGIDSLITLELMKPFQEKLGYLPATLFFEYPCVADLAEYLAEHHGAAFGGERPSETVLGDDAVADGAAPRIHGTVAAPQHKDDADHGNAIAVIGMAGRFPGADTIDGLFEVLKNTTPAWTRVPNERWNAAYLLNDDENPTYTSVGAFLDRIDRFDNEFFGIMPLDAIRMDPQERLFLQTAYQTFLDAGLPARRLAGSKTGVFVGVMNGGYSWLTPHRTSLAPPTSLFWSIANRVSYAFDLKGPSMAVDTACSSSLTALHVAAQSIASGDCDQALVGGVNLIVHPRQYENLSRLHMLSPTDACRPFGEGGDGFIDGEAVCGVLLKPLHEAERDRNRIDGVLLASGINAGGRANGYSAPNLESQTALVRDVFERAGIDPNGIDAIEAHGTGTALGDPIEWQSLTRALMGNRTTGSLPVGSLKGHIGHLESAAGLAGAIKVLLEMRNHTLLPSLGADTPNRHLDATDSPLSVTKAASDWADPPGRPRRAAVSSFGAGGANAHAVFAQHQNASLASPEDRAPYLFVLSARTVSALDAMRLSLRDFCLTASPNPHRLAASLACARDHDKFRAAFVARNANELAAQLSKPLSAVEPAAPAQTAPGAELAVLVQTCLNDPQGRADAAGRLCEAYRAGAMIDWVPLFADVPIMRLPPYPFDERAFWIDAKESRFGTTQLLLDDHRVEGRPVLPAGYLVARLLEESGAASLSMLSFQRWAESIDSLSADRSGSRLVLGDAFGAIAQADIDGDPGGPPTGGRAALLGQQPGLDRQAIYALFARHGYEFGGAFHNLVHAVAEGDQVVARIAPCRYYGLQVSPTLLDAGFQTAILLNPTGPRMAPLSIDRVAVHGKIPRDQPVEVVCRRGDRNAGRIACFDLTFVSLDGKVLLKVDGLKAVETGHEPEKLRRAAEPLSPGAGETAGSVRVFEFN